jgi:hypothetical protein
MREEHSNYSGDLSNESVAFKESSFSRSAVWSDITSQTNGQ